MATTKSTWKRMRRYRVEIVGRALGRPSERLRVICSIVFPNTPYLQVILQHLQQVCLPFSSFPNLLQIGIELHWMSILIHLKICPATLIRSDCCRIFALCPLDMTAACGRNASGGRCGPWCGQSNLWFGFGVSESVW